MAGRPGREKGEALMSEKTTEQCVVEFGRAMEAKLAKNRRKGDRAGWLKLAPPELLRLLRGEVEELAMALESGTADDVESECADVANFAMMVADSFRQRAETTCGKPCRCSVDPLTRTPWSAGSMVSGSSTEDEWLRRHEDKQEPAAKEVRHNSTVLTHERAEEKRQHLVNIQEAHSMRDVITPSKRERY